MSASLIGPATSSLVRNPHAFRSGLRTTVADSCCSNPSVTNGAQQIDLDIYFGVF